MSTIKRLNTLGKAFLGLGLTFLSANQAEASCGAGAAVGQICAFAGQKCPPGTISADGSSFSTSQYRNLFEQIFYAYGGGMSNFNLPDLRSRSAVGVNLSGAEGVSQVTLGQQRGQIAVMLNANTMPMHKHTATFTGHYYNNNQPLAVSPKIIISSNVGTSYSPSPSTPYISGSPGNLTGGQMWSVAPSAGNSANIGGFNITTNAQGFGISSGTVTLKPTGGDIFGGQSGVNTIPPQLAMNYCIVVQSSNSN